MESIYFLKAEERVIEGKKYYRITVLDYSNLQIFNFYRLADKKCTDFVNAYNIFDDVSAELKFVIKRNNKISFDII